MPNFLAREDLDQKIGSLTVTRYIDDSGNAVVDTGSEEDFLNQFMDEAEATAVSHMMSAGYDEAGVTIIAENDPAFKGQVAWIACELLAERRTSFNSDEGWGPYKVQYERSIEYLEKLAKGRRRTKGEAQAGANAQVGGNVSPRPPSGTAAQFTFAPSKKSPSGHGGFLIPLVLAVCEMFRATHGGF